MALMLILTHPFDVARQLVDDECAVPEAGPVYRPAPSLL